MIKEIHYHHCRSAIRSLSFMLLALLLCSCIHPQFEVSFELPENISATYRLCYYASNKKQGLYLETPVILNAGKATVKCPDSNPCLVYIYYGSSDPAVIFWAERGDKIKITGTDTDPETWQIGGNKINEQWTKWRLDNQQMLHNGPEAINAAVEKFVTENPDNKLSTILLLCYFNRAVDNTKFQSLWDSLSKRAKTEKIIRAAARNDLLNAENADNLLDVKLRTLENGCDTLKTQSGRASIIFFWYNGRPERRMAIDTLKKLHSDFPNQTIVDICLEPDSISWQAALSADSLSGTIRAWMPQGPADPWILKTGITTPCSFIVADKTGKIKYRGKDIYKASQTFRKFHTTTANAHQN